MPINAGERGGKKPSRGTDLSFQLLNPSHPCLLLLWISAGEKEAEFSFGRALSGAAGISGKNKLEEAESCIWSRLREWRQKVSGTPAVGRL